MPKFTGKLALELAQQLGNDTPFILISAAVGEEIATEMMKSGARDFVLKGRLWRLGAAVRRELQETELRRRRRGPTLRSRSSPKRAGCSSRRRISLRS